MTNSNAKKMFRHACGFADCALFCEKDVSNLCVKTQGYAVQGIVNSAFACEVFIKSLLVHHGMTLKRVRSLNHGLQELWNHFTKQDKQTAKQIQQSVQDFFSSNDETLFEENLKCASDAFIKWRYLYEGGDARLNLQFLRVFRLILRDVCCEQFYGITWKEFVDGSVQWDVEY